MIYHTTLLRLYCFPRPLLTIIYESVCGKASYLCTGYIVVIAYFYSDLYGNSGVFKPRPWPHGPGHVQFEEGGIVLFIIT